MGRPRKPLALVALEGDTRKIGAKKHAKLTDPGVITRRGRPTMPRALQSCKGDDAAVRRRLTVAREHWRYLADALERARMLTDLDEGMLTTTALNYALALEAARRGEAREYERLQQRYLQAADRMGLKESARAKSEAVRPPIGPPAAPGGNSAAKSYKDQMCG